MAANLKDTLTSIMGELKRIVSTETVVGQPIECGDKKLVPVSTVMVGFGAGGAEGDDLVKESNYSGGGGGGARVEPIGFIIIEKDKVSFLPTRTGQFEGLIEAIPGFVDKIKQLKANRKESQEGVTD